MQTHKQDPDEVDRELESDATRINNEILQDQEGAIQTSDLEIDKDDLDFRLRLTSEWDEAIAGDPRNVVTKEFVKFMDTRNEQQRLDLVATWIRNLKTVRRNSRLIHSFLTIVVNSSNVPSNGCSAVWARESKILGFDLLPNSQAWEDVVPEDPLGRLLLRPFAVLVEKWSLDFYAHYKLNTYLSTASQKRLSMIAKSVTLQQAVIILNQLAWLRRDTWLDRPRDSIFDGVVTSSQYCTTSHILSSSSNHRAWTQYRTSIEAEIPVTTLARYGIQKDRHGLLVVHPPTNGEGLPPLSDRERKTLQIFVKGFKPDNAEPSGPTRLVAIAASSNGGAQSPQNGANPKSRLLAQAAGDVISRSPQQRSEAQAANGLLHLRSTPSPRKTSITSPTPAGALDYLGQQELIEPRAANALLNMKDTSAATASSSSSQFRSSFGSGNDEQGAPHGSHGANQAQTELGSRDTSSDVEEPIPEEEEEVNDRDDGETNHSGNEESTTSRSDTEMQEDESNSSEEPSPPRPSGFLRLGKSYHTSNGLFRLAESYQSRGARSRRSQVVSAAHKAPGVINS